MNKTLIELFGLDPEQFNEVSLSLATKDLPSGWVFLLFVFLLALWFFWTSLKRIHLPLRKTFIITLRIFVLSIVLFIFLQPELEFKKKHTLKNSNYKAPLKYYFDQNNFPYHEFKLGFAPFESTK